MNVVQIRGKLIQYYGNKAGYIEKGKAIVDPLFKTEQLQSYLAKQGLEAEWRDGIHEGLQKVILTRKAAGGSSKAAGSGSSSPKRTS